MKFWLVLVILCMGFAAQAQTFRCSDLFYTVDGIDHRALNPTASRPPGQYLKPNKRTLDETDSILIAPGQTIADMVKDGDTVLDIGAGQAQAMIELAERKSIRAWVIDTFDQSAGIPSRLRKSIQYLVGWAEEVIRRIPSETVHLAIDVWGAFSYSPKKDLLIEEIYRTLKVGGVAKILFVPGASPAKVETDKGRVDLHVWLKTEYPQIFSAHLSSDPDLSLPSYVITIRKINPAPFRLGLSTVSVDRVSGGDLTSVVFRPN